MINRLWSDIVHQAVLEDGAWSDLTTLGLPEPHKEVKGVLLAKQDCVLAGLDIAFQTFQHLSGDGIEWIAEVKDGEKLNDGQVIAVIEAEAWTVLAGERTALNFLQRLSGIATLTRNYVERIEGSGAKIVDTRKTTPCLRIMEKYAVQCGGGLNHRFGLSDGCLIKDNHIEVAGGITQAVTSISQRIPHLWKIEVEVETIKQVEECLMLDIDAILLDNMSISELSQAVQMIGGRMITEASGGITLDNVTQIAETGVNLISIGALTHSAPAIDISLEIKLKSE